LSVIPSPDYVQALEFSRSGVKIQGNAMNCGVFFCPSTAFIKAYVFWPFLKDVNMPALAPLVSAYFSFL